MKVLQKKVIKWIFTKNGKEEEATDSINSLKVELIGKFLNEEITPNDLRILEILCDILENGKEEQKQVLIEKLPRKFYAALKKAFPLLNLAFKLIELIKNRLSDD